SAVSNSAILTIQENPVIDTPPVAQTVCEGGTIQLGVAAHGTGLTYQWYHNGNPLVGQVASTLTILNATTGNAGSYHVVVSGTCNPGGVASAPVNVVVEEAPEVITHPSNQTICEGGNTTLTVDAGVTASATYQWQVNRNDGAGFVNLTADGIHEDVDTDELSINGAPLSYNGYLYRAVITSGGVCVGNAVSNSAILTIQENPVIDTPPVAQTVCEGGTIQLSVAAHGTGLTYQWYHNGNPLVGQVASTLTILNVITGNAGSYHVVVSGTCNPGGVASAPVNVVVEEAPEVIAHPSNQTICEGGNTTLTVDAGVTASATYQWQVNRNDGAGFVNLTADGIHEDVDTDELSINGAPLSYNGYLYRAVITSGGVCAGSAVSNPAILTIQENPVIDTPPVAQTVCEGGTIQLSVAAHGTG